MDKSAIDCCTVEEFKHINETSVARFKARLENDGKQDKKPRKMKKSNVAAAVDQELLGADDQDIVMSGTVFSGFEICIVAGAGEYEKIDLEKVILYIHYY